MIFLLNLKYDVGTIRIELEEVFLKLDLSIFLKTSPLGKKSVAKFNFY